MPKSKISPRNLYPTEPPLRSSPGFAGPPSSMKDSPTSVPKGPLSVSFDIHTTSLINGIVKNLGPENGRTISKKGIKKGLPPFTGPTNFSLGRIAGKYKLSYRTEKDEKGNIIKYIFTTQYGDPENPTEYHELWWDPMEEKMMKLDYRTAVGMGLEPRYTYLTDKEARDAALSLRKELNDGNALEAAPLGTSATEGGTRKRKQTRNRKQKTKKQRTNRK